MLLTMPVLFAFYSMLSQAIELRGAPFVGWITTSRRHDPLLRHAAADGRHDVLAAEDDADDGRPDAAEDDDVHADDVHRSCSCRAPSGLVIYWTREQPAGRSASST